MNQVEAALTRAVVDLDAIGLHWAVAGGIAVSARTEPRFTRDVDVARQVATVEDFALARASVRLITGRGYARGRDLDAALEAFVAGPP